MIANQAIADGQQELSKKTTKEKMSLRAKKHVKTDEHKKNISKSKIGIPSHRKGIKCSEETRLKMSISAKLKPKKFGRKVSEETKAKISLSLRNRKKNETS